MGSNFVKVLAVVVVALTVILDVTLHGHFDDGKIRNLITKNLQNEPIPTLTEVDVRVRDRTAYVSGLVDTPQERVRTTRAALEAPGILTLVNDVRVDLLLEILFQRLKSVMEASPGGGEFDYRVHADGHTVTLEGWVPEGEEDLRDELGRLAEKVPGVRQVINNIGIGDPGADTVRKRIYDILRLQNIYFDYNKATIRPESRDSVKRIAGVLNEYPGVRVQIEGHTDAIASEAYNKKLSDARANSVKTALVEFGVASERVDTIGYGESKPIAPNNTPEGRADNRRIEFNVTSGSIEPKAEIVEETSPAGSTPSGDDDAGAPPSGTPQVPSR
jgi:outer membrane protein OmpA-like peptidoglycan-associated protein